VQEDESDPDQEGELEQVGRPDRTAAIIELPSTTGPSQPATLENRYTPA
jgi:hypothetical protein